MAAHGCPEQLISDNGAEFVARHWTDYLKKMGIHHVRCTPQHPESNGKIERFNRTFKELLAKAVNNSPGDWEDHVGSTLFAHRIRVSDVTHFSPFYLMYGRQPRAPLSRLIHVKDPIQGFGTRVDNLSTAVKAARERTEQSRKYNKLRLAQKANDGILSPGDMVVLLAPEPLTLTSKWDPQWQVTRVSGTTVYLRHQQSGQTKTVHRSKVRLVDSDMVWDEIAPRPRRKQHRGGPAEVTVNIHVDTPQATMNPPRGDPLNKGNPQCSPALQPSTSSEPMDVETEAANIGHPLPLNGPDPTPVLVPAMVDGPSPAQPIRKQLPVTCESKRGCKASHKRELSPSEANTPRCNTRWSSLSDEEKRRKRVRYDVLAGRASKFSSIGSVYIIP